MRKEGLLSHWYGHEPQAARNQRYTPANGRVHHRNSIGDEMRTGEEGEELNDSSSHEYFLRFVFSPSDLFEPQSMSVTVLSC